MEYDIVLIGGGMSGLSLVNAIIDFPQYNPSVLVIEGRQEYTQDKIWSFWNVENEDYDDISLNVWDKFSLHSKDSIIVDSPYQYHSIDSNKYYSKIIEKINNNPQTELKLGSKVKSLNQVGNQRVEIILNSGESIHTNQVFDSRIPQNIEYGKFDLLQHFRGVHIKLDKDCFDPNQVVLMDFRVDQHWGLHFIYVLPLSTKEALIEATWFSKDLVSEEIYDTQITNYLNSMEIEEYSLIYEEKGVIPMSLAIPQQSKWDSIINIGTRGGLTRPSTGYTFLTAQWYSKQIVTELQKEYEQRKIPQMRSSWIDFMDEILLRVLSKHQDAGPNIFVQLFKRNKPSRVINFLSGTSSFREELVMMIKIPKIFLFVKEGFFATLSRLKFWKR